MSKINIFEMYARNFPQDIKMVGNPVKPKTKSAVDIKNMRFKTANTNIYYKLFF